MASGRLRDWIAQRFDDYVEETVVGHRAWIVVLLFTLSGPLFIAAIQIVFPQLYRPYSVGISLFVGFLVGLALVLVARERKRYRVAAIDHTRDIAALRNLPWGEFEVLVGEVFRNRGYVVKERGGFKRDEGIDLIAERGKERVLIQCKHWKWPVREGQVKTLYADVKAHEFTEGWLVTSGRFDSLASSWAEGKEIKLIDGESLIQLMPSVRITDDATAIVSSPNETLRICPNCKAQLRRLTNHHDRSKFWGCINPDCDWTFDDPPAPGEEPKCGRGHAMVVRTTKSGTPYWSCTHTNCSRKRLRAPESAS